MFHDMACNPFCHGTRSSQSSEPARGDQAGAEEAERPDEPLPRDQQPRQQDQPEEAAGHHHPGLCGGALPRLSHLVGLGVGDTSAPPLPLQIIKRRCYSVAGFRIRDSTVLITCGSGRLK